MAAQAVPFYALNRGEVSTLALMRADVERLRLSAETQVNIMPRVVGPAGLRPGTGFVTEVAGSNPCRYVPFIFGVSDTALLEFTDSTLRILVNETPITRDSVATTVPAFSSWATTVSPGATVTGSGTLQISGNLNGQSSKATATVSVSGADQAKRHALRIVVAFGTLQFRVGTAAGLDDIFGSTSLGEGTHSLAFIPNAGTIYVQFESTAFALRQVTSVAMEAAGVMTLPSPYTASMLASLAYESSADTLYMCGGGLQQRKIERRGTYSYSIVLYQSPDGPFPAAEDDASTIITPSKLIGNVTLTANKSIFKTGHVGALIRLFHTGQQTVRDLVAQDTYSDVIRVSGVSKVTAAGGTTTTATQDRTFSLTVAGTWVGTLVLQRSLESADSGFTDYQTYTGNLGPSSISDSLDNIIAWYRIGFKSGGYTSGTATVTISYGGGGAAGIARITGYTSGTQVNAEVLSPLSNTTGTSDWRMQQWSTVAGFPSAVAIHEGRLWFAGQTRMWGSISDAYTSFDLDKEGDSGVINRSIGHGPVQNINWLLPLSRLLAGGDNSIVSARSNSFDEPLTPTVFTLKDSLTVAASSLPAIKIDTSGIFISQSGRKAYELLFDVQLADYSGNDLTRLNQDIGVAGFVDIAVQREPDTRIHFVRADGQVAILLYDKGDQVEAWFRFQTDGIVENVVVLPGTLENRVFYVVKRTINGVTKRYLEKQARLDECVGGAISKLADCHAIYQGVATTTLTGLSYLEGKRVVVWADGKEVGLSSTTPGDPATYLVSGGSITLPIAVSNAVVGLPYTGQFKSAKLAYAAQGGTALNKRKKIDHVGLHLYQTHALGVKFGPRFTTLDDLPRMEDEQLVPVDTINAFYDGDPIEFPGEWDTDSRICFQMQAPRPATVLGFTISIKTNG